MNIIGYSGLNNSLDFKRQHFPNLERNKWRITQGLDSAAALVTNQGIIAAVAEERLNRQKGCPSFPINAINYCLESGGLKVEDIDYLAHSFNYAPLEPLYQQSDFYRQYFQQVLSPAAQLPWLPDQAWEQKLVAVPHHLAHAASCFFPSGFDEALILVSDGMGEEHSATIAIGSRSGIDIIAQIPALHSLGILYSVFTLHLGFAFNFDEYKVMGLAPYGNPRRYFDALMQLVNLKDDGSYSIPLLFTNQTDQERETYSASLAKIAENFGPARHHDEPVEQHHKDIAAALQAVLQRALLHTLHYYRGKTGLDTLCMAGGVALNCSANGVIQRSRLFKNFYVQPAAGDDGAALGAALWVQHQQNPKFSPTPMSLPLLGPEYSDAQICQALEAAEGIEWRQCDDRDELLQLTSQRLHQGQILGWFQGRAEFGPRALGNRSIIADPSAPNMRDRINTLIKKRENFRPFAPAVLAEAATEYFNIDPNNVTAYNAMLFVAPVKARHKEKLPAVTHVDGSARVQTVDAEDHPLFAALIAQFAALAGIPVLLNTSFNVRGQAIVSTPEQAIETFYSAGLDALAIGNFVVWRKPQELKP